MSTSQKFVVILGHPKPGSFNHAMAQTACETLRSQGHSVIFHDLYAEGFDPILTAEEIAAKDSELPKDLLQQIEEIQSADGLVFIHPNWWGGPPAMLRGWIDRVIRQGFAYHFTEKGAVPHFSDKSMYVFSTSNTPREVEINILKDPIDHFWKVIVFGTCGAKNVVRQNFEQMILSTPEDRNRWLDTVKETLSNV